MAEGQPTVAEMQNILRRKLGDDLVPGQDEVLKLIRGGYTSESHLARATRASLERAQLLPATVDLILDAYGAAPPPDVLLDIKECLRDIKSLQLKAASETRHASSISESDLAYVEGVLRIRWALEGDEDAAAAELPDEPDFQWDTVHEATQKKGYMEELEKLVQLPAHMQWSEQVDRNDLLKTYPGTGGATDLPFTIGCRTDALIILSHPSFPPDAKIAATLELKKRVGQQSVRQAKTTFLCASLHSMMPVVSILTDMKQGHAAFYCRGPEPGTGRRVCVQQVFKTLGGLCHFLQMALRSVPQDALKFHGDTMVSVPKLQDPSRMLLQQTTEPSQHSWKAAMAVLATHAAGGSDVARLDDLAAFGDQGLEEGAGELSYFS